MTRDQQVALVQPSIVAKLLGESYFNYMQVFAIYEKRVDSQVDMALSGKTVRNGKAGATIEVYYPVSTDAITGSPGPDSFLEVVLIVRTWNLINKGHAGTGLDCEAIAERLVSTFHQWFLAPVGAAFFPGTTFREAIDTGKPNMQGQKVTLRIGMKSDPLPKTGTPLMAVEISPLTYQLANNTSDPDADIYYTLDGSPPGPGNYGSVFPASSPPNPSQTGTSIVYTEPFTVTPNTIIRWSAWAAGKCGSSENMIIATS